MLICLILSGVTLASAPSWLLSNFICFWKYLICSKELQDVLHSSLEEIKNTSCQCHNWRLLHDVLSRIKKALKLGKHSLQKIKAQTQNSLPYGIYRTYPVLYFIHRAMFQCASAIPQLKNLQVWNVLTRVLLSFHCVCLARCACKNWRRKRRPCLQCPVLTYFYELIKHD